MANFIQRSNRKWVNDDRENWLIVITDASKFDDDPWPIQVRKKLVGRPLSATLSQPAEICGSKKHGGAKT